MIFENCTECGRPTILNSKGLCPNCVFKKNHSGKSQVEIYQERSKANIKVKKKSDSIKQNLIKKKEKHDALIKEDEKTYEEVFGSKPPYCEECSTRLSSIFRNDEGFVVDRFRFSHILSKGAYPEHRHNILNFNLLCFNCHQKWDHGDKESMRIFEENKKIIAQILNY